MELKTWQNDYLYKSFTGKFLIAHEDRFVRFGYDWFERFLKSNGVESMNVNHEKPSPQEELVNDLLSKETGVIVEKYSVAIKKKTEYTF